MSSVAGVFDPAHAHGVGHHWSAGQDRGCCRHGRARNRERSSEDERLEHGIHRNSQGQCSSLTKVPSEREPCDVPMRIGVQGRAPP